MITYGQLKSIAEKKGLRIEVSTRYSKPYEYIAYEDGKCVWKESRTILGYTIGINNLYGRKGKSEWQWFWFETLACYDTLEDDTVVMFTHRYSQVTGNYNKGINDRLSVVSYIKNNA